MGVPGLYRWLVQRYPLIRRKASDPCKPVFTHFYIDFNCIIYNAFPLVKVYEGKYDALFHEVCRYLDVLVQVIRPQEVLYIAVDGPAPFAKCAQQRSRRFVSARDHKPEEFDKTAISVGTEFMEELHNFLLDFFKTKTQSDPVWQKPQLIYSSHRVPGEGEHKFFNFMREARKLEYLNHDKVHCVYSPDADLIFLCLQTREPNFYIMKEYDSWVGPNENVGNGKINKLRSSASDYELLSFSLAREYLKIDFKIKDVDRLVDEFSTISFLLGNDFIPHFPDVIIADGDFEIIVRTYQETMMTKKLFLVENRKINKSNLQYFLQNIIISMQKHKSSKKGQEFDFSQNPNAPSQYLAKKYGDTFLKNPAEFEKELAYAVLDSFDWVFEYYTNGCCSWNWCFKYFFAPPLSIVAKYCPEHTSHFDLDRPPYPLEQLLCILPPQSSKLLPDQVSQLMFEPSPLAKYYPLKFEIDLNGRRFEHEGVVKVPIININEVREEFAKVAPLISEQEKIRNQIDECVTFHNGEITRFDIKTGYIQKTSAKPLGVPSFYSIPIPFTSNIENIHVYLFSRPSFFNSIAIKPSIKPELLLPPEKLQKLVGTVLMVNWPYLIPAYVCSVINPKEFPLDIIKEYKQRYGIILTPDKNQVFLKVNPLGYTNSNETRYRFHSNTIIVPYILSSSVSHVPMFTKFDKTICYRIQKPQKVIVKTDDGYSIGKVVSLDDENVTVQLSKFSEIPSLNEIFEDEDIQWVTNRYLERKLQVIWGALSMLLSKFSVDDQCVAFTAFNSDPSNKEYDRVLDGSCKKNAQGKYIFTKDFCHKFLEYLDSPLVSNLLEFAQNYDDESMRFSIIGKELWGKDAFQSKQKLAQYFSKEAYCHKYFLIDKNIDIISQHSLEMIESKLVELKPLETETAETVNVQIQQVIFPGMGKPKWENIAIGNRVAVISSSGAIPFGETGTVVGVDETTYQAHVILDREQEYANSLRNRLSTNRGIVAMYDDLLVLDK
ncbi:XRN 5'-3' exonuclease N-terminus family protein [Histomonas meleagridis]|uniref:XRN 5'-3' exonuclease N-terminus family protein n=1 Tax=Histomonas meleagridis TaxID=135588 RepID=UPI003559EECF|nr:XRN 5'-3' exonuclease N-terminus family protein [Histomonas meleagridis]KAH0797786.1 XRN 5'-3' exonuclease N-terminus family protein [Histomonas meleagridis]